MEGRMAPCALGKDWVGVILGGAAILGVFIGRVALPDWIHGLNAAALNGYCRVGTDQKVLVHERECYE